MTLTLPRSPTEKQEHAYRWWVQNLGGVPCAHCGSHIPLDNPHLSIRAAYCSNECWRLEENVDERARKSQ